MIDRPLLWISAEIRLRGCQLVAKRNQMRLAASTASPKSVWVQREGWLRGSATTFTELSCAISVGDFGLCARTKLLGPRTQPLLATMSAFGGIADIGACLLYPQKMG